MENKLIDAKTQEIICKKKCRHTKSEKELKEKLKNYRSLVDAPLSVQKDIMRYYLELDYIEDGSIKIAKQKYELAIENLSEKIKYNNEINTAKVIGNLGFEVFILPESNNILLFHGRHSDGIICKRIWAEIKNPESIKRVQSHFANAVSKSELVILDISNLQNFSSEKAFNRLKGLVKDPFTSISNKGIVIINDGLIEQIVYIKKRGTLERVPVAKVRSKPLLQLHHIIRKITVNRLVKLHIQQVVKLLGKFRWIFWHNTF